MQQQMQLTVSASLLLLLLLTAALAPAGGSIGTNSPTVSTVGIRNGTFSGVQGAENVENESGGWS
jgi:hypothetical protein